MLKLRNVETALANFWASGVLRLGRQLGPVLWQLPPRLGFDSGVAAAFFEMLPKTIAAAERSARGHDERVDGRSALLAPDGRRSRILYALEVRDDSWLSPESLRLMERHGIALVAADTAGRYPLSLVRTAPFAYIRLHGSTELYNSRYTDEELAVWAHHIREWASAGSDVYTFFDNTDKTHAPEDAARLLAAVNAGNPPNPEVGRDIRAPRKSDFARKVAGTFRPRGREGSG